MHLVRKANKTRDKNSLGQNFRVFLFGVCVGGGASLHYLVSVASSITVLCVKFTITSVGNQRCLLMFEELVGFQVPVPLAFSHLSPRLL